MNWFEEWFDENYLEVYAHRNTKDAWQQIAIILKNVPLTSKDAILDVGCGTGRYVKLFHQKNYSITGIDLSKKLIELGKKENSKLNLEVANALTYLKKEHYTLILSLFTSWGYYEQDEDNFLILKNMYHNLKPQGFFWLDYSNPYLLKKIKNQEETSFTSQQDKQLTLPRGKYHMVVENPQYFTYRQDLDLQEDTMVPIRLMPHLGKEVKLLTQKKYSSQKDITFWGMDYNKNYFFITDSTHSLKIVLDNNLNIIQEVSYRNFSDLENSFLDKKIFSPLIAFEKWILWKEIFYHPASLSLNDSAKIIFSHWFDNKILLVNQQKAKILLYQFSANQGISPLSSIDLNTLKSFKNFFLSNLVFGQAFFLNSQTILFVEKTNQEVFFYDISTQKIRAFVQDFQNKPVVVEGMFFYDYLVFLIIENNQLAIFDQQGNFFTKFTLPSKVEKLLAFVIKNNMLYLFQKKNIVVYKLL